MSGGAGLRNRAAVLGTQFGEGVLSHVSALFRVFQLNLDLAVFGEVDGGNLLSLLNLAFVGLDLLLEFVDHVLESLLALAVLISLECELLEAAVLLAHTLISLSMTTLLIVELNFKFTHSLFKFLNHTLATLE